MAALVDWQIREACEGFPTTWRKRIPGPPPRYEPRYETRPIPDAGPLITPFDESLLDTASVDMRLGHLFESPTEFEAWVLYRDVRISRAKVAPTPRSFVLEGSEQIRRHGGTGVEVVLHHGQSVACESLEYYRLPPDLGGTIYTKSSRAREWINHSTASAIAPGFQGRIAFELLYTGHRPYVLRSGMRVIHIAFSRTSGVPERPYFDRGDAKYRSQDGNVRSADPDGRA
jgi:deoxycytidine triphosphate deaminase